MMWCFCDIWYTLMFLYTNVDIQLFHVMLYSNVTIKKEKFLIQSQFYTIHTAKYKY